MNSREQEQNKERLVSNQGTERTSHQQLFLSFFRETHYMAINHAYIVRSIHEMKVSGNSSNRKKQKTDLSLSPACRTVFRIAVSVSRLSLSFISVAVVGSSDRHSYMLERLNEVSLVPPVQGSASWGPKRGPSATSSWVKCSRFGS